MKDFIGVIKKYYWVFFSVLIVGAALVYLSLTRDTFVWADEAYTFAMIKHSFKEMWNITAADVHPPLYYILLKSFTMVFPTTLFTAKVFSVIPYIAIIVFGGIQFKELFGKKVSLLFMLLFLVFPSILIYSVEVRMYSWATLFVFLNAVYGYRCCEFSKLSDWILFAVFGVCAAYTHYFAMVSVGIVYGILLIVAIKNKKTKEWFIAAGLTILLYLPWIGKFVEQLAFKISNEYWIDEITLGSIVGYVYRMFGVEGFSKFWLISILMYLMVFGCIVFAKNKKAIILALCIVAVPAGTIAVGVIASWLVRPVFIFRYIIPSLSLLVAFLAIFLGMVNNRFLTLAVVIVMLFGGCVNYVHTLGNADAYENPLNAEIINEYADSDCYVVLTESSHFSSIVSYYENIKPIYRLKLISGDNPYENMKHMDDFEFGKYAKIVLLVDQGEEISPEYKDAYEVKFEKTVCEYDKKADLYLLTERE